MSVVPVPPDEGSRLRLLHRLRILDTDPEPLFDGAASAAARLAGTPIALVSLVDAHRQWFKARVGLDAVETSREVAFCSWAILEPGQVFEVPDAREDWRFAHNPLVLGAPGIRFYAGVPLEVEPGRALGTLCVIDRRPRRLSSARRDGLVALGSLVTEALRHRLELHEAARRDRILRSLQSEVVGLLDLDPVTKLASQRKLETLETGLVESGRVDGLGAIAIEIEGFAQVNDGFGRAAGDRLLAMVANRLQAASPGGSMLGRLEGPRFALMVQGRSEVALVELARSVLVALERPFFDPSAWDRPISLTVRAGVACYPSARAAGSVIEAVQLALSGASERRQAIAPFRPELRTKVRDRLAATHDLRSILVSGEVEVAFQPIVALPTLETVGSESLLRLSAPSLASLPVPTVVELAQESGLMRSLTRAVLRRSLTELVEIDRAPLWEGHQPRRPVVSVNLSQADLVDARLVEEVGAALVEAGLDPERLVVEVTEGQLLADREQAAKTLTALRALGVGVALDDFGTGYSSLSYLATLPVDFVKVDRTFIAGATTPGARRLLASISMVAHDLGMRSVAEGVESPDELRLVSALGFDFAQGYLTGRPSRPPEVAQRLRSGAPPVLEGVVNVLELERHPRRKARRRTRPSGTC